MKYIEKKLEDAQTGAIVDYHEIVNIGVDYINNSVSVTIASYVSSNGRENNKNPLSYNSFYLDEAPSREVNIHDWALSQLIINEPEGFVRDDNAINPYFFAGGKIKEIELLPK